MDVTASATCPACEAPRIDAGDDFCESCGHRFTPPCVACGQQVIDADGYCESCGVRQPTGRDHLEIELPEAAGVTDRGLRHAHNEDAMAFAAFGDYVLAVVCDGVSNSPRPEEASQAAADTAVEVLKTELGGGAEPVAANLAAVTAAAKAVNALAESPAHAPACTYACAVVSPTEATVCWVGDSRVYWLSGDTSDQLTVDDSLAVAMATAGGVSAEEVLELPDGHALVHWLGADSGVLEPHVETFTLDRPGCVLVCSDGLWNDVPDAQVLETVMAKPEQAPIETARTLVRMALDAGGHDNITVVLVPFGGAHD